MANDEAPGRRGLAHHREIEPPFAKDRFGLGFLFGLEHHEHALLALREHHFIGRHAGFPARHLVEVQGDAEIALGAHLDRRAGEACRPHVLDRDDAAFGHDFKAGFEQQLFCERVADLHRRALFLGILAELGRRHCGAMDAVAAGLGAEIDDRHADARGGRIENLVGLGKADRHGVDQDIAVVTTVKPHRAADRRHPEGIAVTADAGHHAGDQMAGPRVVRIPQRQRIEAGDRPRPHGEDVAQDATDARCGALIGFDVARMVVALHLEHAGEPTPDVDDAGVLARALDHAAPGGWEAAQVNLGGFIGAVLIPHGGEDAELGEARCATDQLQDSVVLVRLQAVLGDQLRRDFRLAGNHSELKSVRDRQNNNEPRFVVLATATRPDPSALRAPRTARAHRWDPRPPPHDFPDAASCRARCRAR